MFYNNLKDIFKNHQNLLDHTLFHLMIFRFEDSAIFETPPLNRASMQGKSRHTSKKREINDPFEGLEKYGVNLGNENDENVASKKRRRYRIKK